MWTTHGKWVRFQLFSQRRVRILADFIYLFIYFTTISDYFCAKCPQTNRD